MVSFWCLGLHCSAVLMKLSWVKMPSLEIASPVSECSAVTLMNKELFKKIQYWTFPLGATEFQSWNISQERLNLKLQAFSEVLICGMLNLSSYRACGLIPQMMKAIYISVWSLGEWETFWGLGTATLVSSKKFGRRQRPHGYPSTALQEFPKAQSRFFSWEEELYPLSLVSLVNHHAWLRAVSPGWSRGSTLKNPLILTSCSRGLKRLTEAGSAYSQQTSQTSCFNVINLECSASWVWECAGPGRANQEAKT